ncbi:Rieske domain-containing -like [Micractinium conductrix]|uniref:Rieske domain-containing -like n=1 Tax=Micractinium conductrix TaxID=554055 RepID=A0A2P6VMM2_9CHLO|nr:Rieske domain-containing -like [Micractinium conductrix]|eukprot:PSC75330.1 Rieske domain-containing -like [Micractinium conductrix]
MDVAGEAMHQQQQQDGGGEWHFLGRLEDAPSGGRLHGQVEGRYVTVLQHEEQLYCLDSVCFHAGGPLALGDVEELPDGRSCLKCPWHYYLVDIANGEKFYQGTVAGPDGKLLPGPWKSVGKRQRTHRVEQRPDGIYVQLNLEGHLASDEYAHKHECGLRVQTGHLRLSPQHLHASNGVHEGGRAPRLGSPHMGSPRGSPPASPRYSGEGEDCWPEDLPEPHSRHSRRNVGGGTQL